MTRIFTEEQKAIRRARTAAWRLANPEKVVEQQTQYYERNKDAIKEARAKERKENPTKQLECYRRWRKANPEKALEHSRKWRIANPTYDVGRSTKWCKENPDKNAARTALGNARKMGSAPHWANEFIIAEAYELAQLRTKATGVRHNVVHIVPLRNKRVCGLHCEFNVQVIPGKGNRHRPDTP